MTKRRTVAKSDVVLLTVEEAAAHMNMSVRHVRRLVAERRIAFHRLGRNIRLSLSDVEEYVSAGRVEPITDATVWRELKGAA